MSFDANMANVCAAAARAVRTQMGKTPCVYCRRHYGPTSKTFDRSSSSCRDRDACVARAMAKLAGSGRFSPRAGADVAADYSRYLAATAGAR